MNRLDMSVGILPSSYISDDGVVMSASCWPNNFMPGGISPAKNILSPPISDALTPEPRLSVPSQPDEGSTIFRSEQAHTTMPHLLPRFTGAEDVSLRQYFDDLSDQCSSSATNTSQAQVSKSSKPDSRNSERRRAQNRNAQRLYRRRKDQRLAEKEIEVAELREQLERERKLNKAWSKVVELLKDGTMTERPHIQERNSMPDSDTAAIAAQLEQVFPRDSRQVSPFTRDPFQQYLPQSSKGGSSPSFFSSDRDDSSRYSG